LSDVLRIKRTLDGAEIDKIIADVQARKTLAIEHRRRPIGVSASWRPTVFRRNVAMRVPYRCHILHQIRYGD